MTRKQFLKIISILPLTGIAMKLNAIKIPDPSSNTELMPVLFLGHGSPMNAIEENEFVTGFRNIVKTIPKPDSILCVSAHWETKGTFVTAMEKPETIHDFGGFPKALFDVQYPAPGNPELAKKIKKMIAKTEVGLDYKWGLDHGTWSVVKHLYPQADIPVIQLSLDYEKSPQFHYDLAKELSSLRKQRILIIGSGNIVHNLGLLAWDQLKTSDYAFDWATEAKEKIKKFILTNDHKELIQFRAQGKSFDLAIPTLEHFLPLLYMLALKEENETIHFFNDKTVAGSLAMTSLKIEKA